MKCLGRVQINVCHAKKSFIRLSLFQIPHVMLLNSYDMRVFTGDDFSFYRWSHNVYNLEPWSDKIAIPMYILIQGLSGLLPMQRTEVWPSDQIENGISEHRFYILFFIKNILRDGSSKKTGIKYFFPLFKESPQNL